MDWIQQTIHGACSGDTAVLMGTQGEFGTVGNIYDNNERCQWRVEVEQGQQVRLHFLRFRLESCCSCDNVKIYDGSDSTAPVIRSLCGAVLPADIIASGNTVFIQFVSDNSGRYAGFRIQYSAFLPVEGCGGKPAKLVGSKGTFGINQTQYDNYLSCSWSIQVDTTKIIRLEFASFDVQFSFDVRNNTTCNHDMVKVYDGANSSSPLLGIFCGSMVPGDVISGSSSLFVTFESDRSVTGSGFDIEYSEIEETEYCDGNLAHLGGQKGQIWITRPQYKNNLHCQWQINVDDGKRVHLHFERFDVQETTNCANDSLVITDIDAGNVTYVLCGNNLPGDVMSSGNGLSVVFRTDSSVTKNGFVITYTARTVMPGM
ncbi:Cubilin [Lamellibrachia satsuma]|nr:Cubilin [Lamellibrachia satsuma]